MEEENRKLIELVTTISNMCIGEVAMGFTLDAEEIGQMIYTATGLTNPQLNDRELKERLEAKQIEG